VCLKELRTAAGSGRRKNRLSQRRQPAQ
jgi:hypothetical protein